jgi:hypothetical protein
MISQNRDRFVLDVLNNGMVFVYQLRSEQDRAQQEKPFKARMLAETKDAGAAAAPLHRFGLQLLERAVPVSRKGVLMMAASAGRGRSRRTARRRRCCRRRRRGDAAKTTARSTAGRRSGTR